MDVFCTVCEHRHDMDSPDVEPAAWPPGEWICTDESACLERLTLLRELLTGGEA